MGKPAAKKGDKVVALDTHIVMVPAPSGQVPTPMPMQFNGKLDKKLSKNVLIQNKAAATKGSKASNSQKHVATGGTLQKDPSNKATVKTGSKKVLINDKEAAHSGDTAETCNDPTDTSGGTVIGSGSVLIGS